MLEQRLSVSDGGSVVKNTPKHSEEYLQVERTEDNIISLKVAGTVTGRLMRDATRQVRDLVEQLKREKRPVLLLVDIREARHHTSEARSQGKRLAALGIDKMAIFGGNRLLNMIGQYVLQASGTKSEAKFFRGGARATDWLLYGLPGRRLSHRIDVQLLACVVALISVATIVGWLTNNITLVAVLPRLKPMDPLAAVNLVLIAYAVTLLIQLKPGNKLRTVGVWLIGGWLMVYGLLVLAQFAWHTELGIDTWLFTDKLNTLGRFPGRSSPNTALNVVLIGGMLCLALSGLKRRWQVYLFRVLTGLSVLSLLVVLVGYGFGVATLYAPDSFIPMSLNAATALLLADVMVIAAVYRADLFPASRRLLSLYWQGVLVFALVAFVTGYAWQQTRVSIQQNADAQTRQVFDKTTTALTSQVSAYIDALRGFKAFFESSSFVEADEYDKYFDSSGLEQNYPGFSAISFIRYVPQSGKKAFEAQMRAQAAYIPQYKSFTVQDTGTANFYAVTYVAPHTATTGYGTNLGTRPDRLKTFEAARDTGQPATSDVIELNATNGKPNYGFLISIPIYTPELPEPTTVAARRQHLYGIVNAVFRNDVLFTDIFKSLPVDKSAAFTISDPDEGMVLYQSPASSGLERTQPRFSQTIHVAGQEWNIALRTTDTYGVVGITRYEPDLVLAGGLLLALLAGLLAVSQSRRREQALALASSMTEDLNNERDAAVAVQQKDDAILSSIGDAVFAIDTEERITLFNPSAAKISGYTVEEALGKPYYKILPFKFETDHKLNHSFISRAFQGHVTSMKNHTLLARKDGSTVAVADSAAPIRDAKGNILGVIVVFRDVSKEQALDEAKSEFVSLASHQLRTPLSAINWYSEMLLSGDAGTINKDQHEYIREIFEGNQRMIELVDSLLNVSRLEVGRLKNDPAPTSMLELAASLQKELATSITTKQLTFKRNAPASLPTVFADPKLLRMIVQNLLSNAVKYTPDKGSVTLTMRLATSREIAAAKLRAGSRCLFMSVTDTGYGIPRGQQGKIFEKLFRADNVRKLDVEGTGLGLYIVREVARKLGGNVWFESAEQKGTTFYVVLPLKPHAS